MPGKPLVVIKTNRAFNPEIWKIRAYTQHGTTVLWPLSIPSAYLCRTGISFFFPTLQFSFKCKVEWTQNIGGIKDEWKMKNLHLQIPTRAYYRRCYPGKAILDLLTSYTTGTLSTRELHLGEHIICKARFSVEWERWGSPWVLLFYFCSVWRCFHSWHGISFRSYSFQIGFPLPSFRFAGM